jgi:hypothetical protein
MRSKYTFIAIISHRQELYGGGETVKEEPLAILDEEKLYSSNPH